MTITDSIFPKRCYMGYTDKGKLSATGEMFLREQQLSHLQGRGAENPCFGCRVDDCGVRGVTYHNLNKRYILAPDHL